MANHASARAPQLHTINTPRKKPVGYSQRAPTISVLRTMTTRAIIPNLPSAVAERSPKILIVMLPVLRIFDPP
jgi:hypothetical protein